MLAYALVICFIIILLFMVYVYAQWRIKHIERYSEYTSVLKVCGNEENSQQHDDIFNISSRVQGQEHPWPTHDNYLSIEHINVSNQLNKPNYVDAPPSYEEAMRIAELNSSGSSTTPQAVVSAPRLTSPPTPAAAIVAGPKTTD